jgi:hypothetical protein
MDKVHNLQRRKENSREIDEVDIKRKDKSGQ